MEGVNWWDIGLIVTAGYLAAMALVRLMLAYREAKITELKRLFDEHQREAKANTKESKSTKRSAA